MRHHCTCTAIGLAAVLIIGCSPMAASALTIAPAYVDRTLNPGDTVIEALQVLNDQDEPAAVYPTVLNFTSGDDEQGAPRFYAANDDPYGTALARWLTVSSEKVELAPKQRTSLLFTINIPANARPGGYYGAVALASSPPGPAGSGVGVQYQLAELVLVTVTGEVREKGSVAEFGFVEPRLWYENLPIDFFFRYQNSGNTHLRPTGEIIITDWVGRQAASIRVNEEFKSVLPLSIRRFQSRWGDELGGDETGSGFLAGLSREFRHFALGRYKVKLFLDNGSQEKVLAAKREVTVWPWKLMVVSGAVIVVVLAVLVWLVRGHARSVARRRDKKDAK